MPEYSIDELMRRACGLWGRESPESLTADGDAAREALPLYGFDPERAAVAALRGGDLYSGAITVLETYALMGLSDQGASGDIDAWARDVRFASDALRAWPDALEERVGDELRLEAAEGAAGVTDAQPLAAEEETRLAASAAQCRREEAARWDEAFDQRWALIEVMRADREGAIDARIRQLADETRRLRGLGT